MHGQGDADWPSYNKTLTSERFSALDEITTANVKNLKVLCTYDTGQYTGFSFGLLEVRGALVFTAEYDIFQSIPMIAARIGACMKSIRPPRRKASAVTIADPKKAAPGADRNRA
ncbi:hypothetical protein CCR94_04475 [Rhodoblastus sphagnicola]|uniref:Pyrrolo-quinoline quinone repeat domain-containing protein n=1 Tax=Rhodoblastus sphagnicola TaxID=333368 RepID=A0A2S6NDI6_9HYPH|nr:hypothetical protein CCR94_04475 [Rhodoblastus sphagnicola]